jgi:radical SAM protein with 4Fe4S-binding SPASM domain
MTLSDFKKSLDSLELFWKKNGIAFNYLTIEYVGGEILLMPEEELVQIVLYARKFFSEKGITVLDGAQSNLLGSKAKIDALFSLFENRVGTSIDDFSEQRTIGGNHSKYKTFFIKSESHIRKSVRSKSTPGIFTMDSVNISNTVHQIKKSAYAGRNITIRPVFQGGCSINPVSPEQLSGAMVDSLGAWFMKMPIILEPMLSLLKKRLSETTGVYPGVNMDFCSFQANCTSKSASLEPNGDVYICQDLADAGFGKFGNAISDDWDIELFNLISKRPERLDPSCYSCPYLKSCQGGCMLKSVEEGLDWYGKSSLCLAWKNTFKKIDMLVAENDINDICKWLDRIEGES